jgi:hypothetical protein
MIDWFPLEENLLDLEKETSEDESVEEEKRQEKYDAFELDD